MALALWGRPLGENGSEVLIAIGGAMIGAVAGYLGARGGPP